MNEIKNDAKTPDINPVANASNVISETVRFELALNKVLLNFLTAVRMFVIYPKYAVVPSRKCKGNLPVASWYCTDV